MCLLGHIPGRTPFLETTPLLLSLCAYQSTSQRKEYIAVVVSPFGDTAAVGIVSMRGKASRIVS